MKKIQQMFSEVYPYLRLEFITTGSKKQFTSKKIALNDPNCFVDNIKINGERTIREVEEEIRECFHVPVQVLRKTGSVWIETTYTQDWTLEQQNKEGEALSRNA